jgi:hypothetical protein
MCAAKTKTRNWHPLFFTLAPSIVHLDSDEFTMLVRPEVSPYCASAPSSSLREQEISATVIRVEAASVAAIASMLGGR